MGPSLVERSTGRGVSLRVLWKPQERGGPGPCLAVATEEK